MGLAESLARPWRVVLSVLIVVAVPLLALGEFVAIDSRGRLEHVERRITDDLATRAAELMGTRLAELADQVSGIALSSELATARTQTDDVTQRLLETYRSALSADIERMLVIREAPRSDAPASVVVAQFPIAGASAPASDYIPRSGSFTSVRRARIVTHEFLPAGIVFSEAIRLTPSFGRHGFVAEMPLLTIAEWLTPLLASAREIHIIDELDRVIASASPQGAAASLTVIQDPHELANRPSDLVAIAELPDLPWKAVVVREPSAVIAFDEAAGIQRALRLAMLAALLLAAYVIGSVMTRLQSERRELGVANARLDAASEAKSHFIAAISHDLRTPLNAILGFSDVLLQRIFGELNDKQAEYLRDIHGAGEHQLALVNDLLDLSKIEAGKMELHPVPFSLRELIGGAIAIVQPLADEKGVRLDGSVAADVGTVEQDPARVRQIVLNLLSNAIKFTESGGSVTTNASVLDGILTLAVTDTGVGISPEDQALVFEEFRQVGASARSAQGTGLGLALVRGFARMMGGRVSLRSELREGSTFTVEIPVHASYSV